MFYSQFILAKKGPLGTIWIAAHLERKLRKNQVADTDIGVSVDSILFPEVPIALRLSSHLLVGVVRIYSKKVNYLFDDCSEALLKIKQAFRSTAVDLPPEESTAPYHSITLPETFDLDDFELPDNAIFQGNYVDHHISSREQITLQDTMEGVVYSTSQFGLDERFGDGDTSGLDLDEELLMEKVVSEGHSNGPLRSESIADPRASVHEEDTLKKDDYQETVAVNLETTTATTRLNQIGDLDDGDTDHAEYAQAPCTPGLWEEPNLPNVQETSAFDDHLEPENYNLPESAVMEKFENVTSNSEFYNGHKSMEDADLDPTHSVSVLENGSHLPKEKSSVIEVTAEQISNHIEAASVTSSVLGEDISIKVSENISNASAVVDQVSTQNVEDIMMEPPGATCEDHVNSEGNESESNNLVVAGDMNNTCPLGNELESYIELYKTTCLDAQETPSSREPQFSNNPNIPTLRPCTTHLNQPDALNSVGEKILDPRIPFEGEKIHTNDGSDRSLEETYIHMASSKTVDTVDNTISGKSHLDNIVSSESFSMPAPEILLSVPEELANVRANLFPESTPNREVLEGGDADEGRSNTLAGRKRSFAESDSTVHSLDATKFMGAFGTKMTTESIPDDDDLLSSILVGRKSSMLRVRSTPPLEMTSRKRRRSAPRTGTSKRKVLLDDMMVLHGDKIRQQLTSTEDIRRIRKKAPCTRPEISMIQKQFWEDEIFTEPIFTGVSMELASIHNQAYDLTQIRIIKADTSFESSTAIQLSSQNDHSSSGLEASKTMDANVKEKSEAQPLGTPALTDNQLSDDNHVGSELCPSTCVTEPRNSEHEIVGETTLMEIDGKTHSDTNMGVPAVALEVESSSHPENLGPSNACDLAVYTVQLVSEQTNEAGASLHVNEQGELPKQKLDMLSIEENACVDTGGNLGSDRGDEGDNTGADRDNNTNVISEGKGDVANEAELVLERNEDGHTVEMASKNEGDCLQETHTAIRTATFSPETGCGSTQIPSHDQAMQEVPEEGQKLIMGSPLLDAEEYNAKNAAPDKSYGDDFLIDPSFSAEFNVHSENIIFEDGENPNHQEAYPMVMQNSDFSAVELEDQHDSYYATVGHDTEFLNVDDDDEADVDGDFVPNAEESHFVDNSGWSTRTRAVAKYLQTLFDKESERGREVLPVDNLLVGKTRKEASRMFFETLVLKTKDFIHVEQRNPYDNIDLLPRIKLMKSDF